MVKRYLSLVSLEEALETIRGAFPFEAGRRTLPLQQAAGNITARPIFARYSVPQLHLSAMDGIAVKSVQTVGASEQRPITLSDAKRVNTGNIVPQDMIQLVQAHSEGRVADAQQAHLRLFPLCRDMLGLATNPIPIKAAMKMLGRDSGELRLPMTALDSDQEASLRQTLVDYGLI